MIRPPRRRKQQQQTGTKSHLLDSSLPNDDEYSFASSSAAASTSTTTKNATNKKPSSKITTAPKHSHKSASSRSRPAIEKENVDNADCDSRCEKEGNAVALSRGLPQNATRKKYHTEIDFKSTILDPMEELSGTLTNLTIDTKNSDISSASENRIGDAEISAKDAHISPFPPIGFGATNITISVSDDGKPRFIL